MIVWTRDAMRLEGDLDGDAAARLSAQLAHLPESGPSLRIEMDELDLLDGVAVAETVNGLRALQQRWDTLVLVEAPQMLAHTLYKVGMLESGRIRLIAPREDEGTTAN